MQMGHRRRAEIGLKLVLALTDVDHPILPGSLVLLSRTITALWASMQSRPAGRLELMKALVHSKHYISDGEQGAIYICRSSTRIACTGSSKDKSV